MGTNMSATGLLLSDDLLFISRIAGTARAAGVEMTAVRTADELLYQARTKAPACVLLDLQNPGLDVGDVVRNLKSEGGPHIVGYGSHVDTATLAAARAAGCDLVLPRSAFVKDLATELPKWIAARQS
jgi:CheY-like chemotaxis protein